MILEEEKIAGIFLMLLLAVNMGFSQNVEFDKKNFSKDEKKDFKEANRELKEGDDYFAYNRFSTALQHYISAQRFNPDNALLNYKVGKCYLRTVSKIKSIPYLEKAYKLNPSIVPEIRYLLGQAYQLNYEFDKAIIAFKEYRSDMGLKDIKEIRLRTEEVNKKIEECNVGKRLVAKPKRVFIDNLKAVNSQFPEYSPLISADESIMIFTARRSNTTGGGKDDASDFMYFEDVYVSFNHDDKWTSPINIGPPINSDVHDATVGLAPDGQQLFVYRFKMGDGGDIYQCELNGDNWSKPKHLGKNINNISQYYF